DAIGRIRPDADRRSLVRRLATAYPETWTYAVDGLTGASPEMLVRVLGREVATRVLAGTLARGRDERSDEAARAALAGSAKNLHEHRLAVDSALESLRALDSHDDLLGGLTASPEPFVLGLPNVWHLASDIRGTLPASASILDLVEALHPTAAVGGTPRAESQAAIDELEPFDRRRYAGPAGWVSADGDGEWVIALRGAEIDPDGAVTAYAGGGIVATSEIDEEWDETIAKLAPIADALG
ncbi:MAG: chorismate-binding protein, partial [Microbacteriaceae bacterium]|nr:chorismate-binding protein [Microbacteriaceae bacterium]